MGFKGDNYEETNYLISRKAIAILKTTSFFISRSVSLLIRTDQRLASVSRPSVLIPLSILLKYLLDFWQVVDVINMDVVMEVLFSTRSAVHFKTLRFTLLGLEGSIIAWPGEIRLRL